MGGRIRRALPASTRNQLWLTGLFLALLALFMMTGARAFLAWPMYESLLSALPLYGFLALGLTLVVAAGEMDLCFPSTLAVAGFGFALTGIHTGQVWLGVIVAILIGRYGPHYRLITYTTMSANLMLREVGISLYLAGVGLGAGEDFVPTLVAGGYVWIAYGAVITIVPLLLAGLFGRFYYKLNYYTLIGVLSGASTNPPALA